MTQAGPVPYRPALNLRIKTGSRDASGSRTHSVRSRDGLTQLGDEEYFIFSALDGVSSFAEIEGEFRARFAGDLSRPHFQVLIDELLEAGIIEPVAPVEAEPHLCSSCRGIGPGAAHRKAGSACSVRNPERGADFARTFPVCPAGRSSAALRLAADPRNGACRSAAVHRTDAFVQTAGAAVSMGGDRLSLESSDRRRLGPGRAGDRAGDRGRVPRHRVGGAPGARVGFDCAFR